LQSPRTFFDEGTEQLVAGRKLEKLVGRLLRVRLSTVVAIMFAIRVAYVLAVPDLDGDAYGHFGIASRVLAHPTDLSPHWVWLPGYHFLLAGLQALGARFVHVRLLNAALQCLGPVLLYRYARIHASRVVALLAAATFALSALPNDVGTSALSEGSFTLLVLGAALGIDRGATKLGWAVLAGVLLLLACTMRYEAWAASAALSVAWLVDAVRTKKPMWRALPAALLPSVFVVGYIVFRRFYDGEWFWFVRETLKFTNMQRHVLHRSLLFEAFWFPICLPWKLLGPAVLLAPIGLFAGGKRVSSLPPSVFVPAAIATFVLTLYAGSSILGLARYWSALMPFVCLLVAQGAVWLASRFRTVRLPFVVLAVLASVSFATIATMRASARQALPHAAELRATEAKLDHHT